MTVTVGEYIVHKERNIQHHMIALGTIEGNPVYMDFTTHMISAIHADDKRGYRNGGPAQATEITRAKDYALFCRQYIHAENMNKFNTVPRDRNGKPWMSKKDEPLNRGYSFFTDVSNPKKEAA